MFKINDKVVSDLGVGRVTSYHDGMVTVSYGGLLWTHFAEEVAHAPKKTGFFRRWLHV